MNTVVLGLQWGDEGKGKAIDCLAHDFDVVVRYQGGHNAGHTIYHQGKKMILHLLPSGIFSPHTISVIANGVVVNPLQLVDEINRMNDEGFNLQQLELSLFCPLILPEHQQKDIAGEDSASVKIGTTRRGIGPAYEDLIGRRAVFVKDLFDKDVFYKKVNALNAYHRNEIGDQIVSVDSYIDPYMEAGKMLKHYARNTVYSLNRYFREGKRMLFEGAQGVLLDVNFGTYPFVTSSNPTVGGIFTGTGLPHTAVGTVTGISKAYATRVGEGPFPSELLDRDGERLRDRGKEYGSTTGRPRRVGWLDLVALKYAMMINGVNTIFLTKLDVLDACDEIKVVAAYETGEGTLTEVFDPSAEFLEGVKPVFKTLPGWKTDTGNIASYGELPPEARAYIEFIESFTEVPVNYISVGAERDQTIKK